MATLNMAAPLLLAEDKMHKQPDNDAERYGAHGTCMMPSSIPRIRAVSTMARTLIAGPGAERRVVSPRPAPMHQMPVKSGNTVQTNGQNDCQTRRPRHTPGLWVRWPRVLHHRRLADEDRYGFPAMKNAGTRQRNVFPRIPFHKLQGFRDGVVETRDAHRQIETRQENSHDCG